MPNFAEARLDLGAYLAARVPLISIWTVEQARALRLVQDAASHRRHASLPFWVHTSVAGLRDLRSGAPADAHRSLAAAIDFAAAEFARRARTTMVFVDPGHPGAGGPGGRDFADLTRLAQANSGSVVLIRDTPPPDALRRLGMGIRLDLPNTVEMYDIIVTFLNDHQDAARIAWTDQDAWRAAEFLVGVPERTAVNVMATIVAKGTVERSDVEYLSHFKDRHFADLAGLERVPAHETGLEIAGLRGLRAWLLRKRELMVADLRGTDLRPPRGVLLVGVPGCGKSLSAKAVAAQWRLPLYRLDLAVVCGPDAGGHDARLRAALDAADQMAPCVLWIDEIESGSPTPGDAADARRVPGAFLFWLQESRSRVFVVATANDVRALTPETVRRGRFDELFFIDLPDASDRREMIGIYYRKYLHRDVPSSLMDELVAASEGFAGSDIESSLHDVGVEALLRGGPERLPQDFVIAAFTNVAPLSRTDPERIEEVRRWSRDRAVPAGHDTGEAPDGRPGRRVLIPDG